MGRCIPTTPPASADRPRLAARTHTPADIVEFYRGVNASCGGTGTYYTPTKSYIKKGEGPNL